MSFAILATGDEIVQGDTLNTNSHAIAHALHSLGLDLGLHLCCSDNEQEMFSSIEFLSKNHTHIITTGGLGPTSDDRTRFIIARFAELELIERAEAYAHVEERLARARLTMNAGNRQQAMFPKGAHLLPNPHGTAMGCYFYWQEKCFIMLPGPPRECLPMFNDYILPLLQDTEHSNQSWLKWRLFGVAEGQIAELLDDALKNVDCQTGYRLEAPYLEFKVRCDEKNAAKVKHIIEPIVAPHIIATTHKRASECLAHTIEELQVPIVIIDDVTGGALQTLIQRPANYRWLSFHESNSTAVIQFHLTGLDGYWLGSLGDAEVQLTINYQNAEEQGSEQHQLPYRSALIVQQAAEWLSYRLLHLINQLHQ